MMQVYFLSIIYLLLGAGFLLSDSYGIKFALLLSLRYAFRTSKRFRRILIFSGLLLTVLLCFFPMDPGPVLLGDLLPLINVFSLTVWFLFQAVKHVSDAQDSDENSVLEATGLYFERNKRNFGYVTCLVSLLHFFVPFSVLL
ncbi:MAG: hypothetical protein WC136_11645 [Sphaerochaeta sp.]|nr:hypothetical protein [Sphaerochaeta sp.]